MITSILTIFFGILLYNVVQYLYTECLCLLSDMIISDDYPIAIRSKTSIVKLIKNYLRQRKVNKWYSTLPESYTFKTSRYIKSKDRFEMTIPSWATMNSTLNPSNNGLTSFDKVTAYEWSNNPHHDEGEEMALLFNEALKHQNFKTQMKVIADE